MLEIDIVLAFKVIENRRIGLNFPGLLIPEVEFICSRSVFGDFMDFKPLFVNRFKKISLVTSEH